MCVRTVRVYFEYKCRPHTQQANNNTHTHTCACAKSYITIVILKLKTYKNCATFDVKFNSALLINMSFYQTPKIN